jgi:hypothetical protein
MSGDPFLAPRDPGEASADGVVREFLLRQLKLAKVYRQQGTGYALIVPQLRGARLLTVPGANEADFMFHGNRGTSGHHLADFIAEAIKDAGADHLRLPLLSEDQAAYLQTCLTTRLPEWLWTTSLSAVIPQAAGSFKEASRLRRAIRRAERTGLALRCPDRVSAAELEELHARCWGQHSRTRTFFGMLDALCEAGLAEIATARTPDGALLAAQVDILGTGTRHFYHAANDARRVAGCGTAVLGLSWERFTISPTQTVYSFGRGAERYKYQYANCHRTVFDVRGFYAPV